MVEAVAANAGVVAGAGRTSARIAADVAMEAGCLGIYCASVPNCPGRILN